MSKSISSDSVRVYVARDADDLVASRVSSVVTYLSWWNAQTLRLLQHFDMLTSHNFADYNRELSREDLFPHWLALRLSEFDSDYQRERFRMTAPAKFDEYLDEHPLPAFVPFNDDELPFIKWSDEQNEFVFDEEAFRADSGEIYAVTLDESEVIGRLKAAADALSGLDFSGLNLRSFFDVSEDGHVSLRESIRRPCWELLVRNSTHQEEGE